MYAQLYLARGNKSKEDSLTSRTLKILSDFYRNRRASLSDSINVNISPANNVNF